MHICFLKCGSIYDNLKDKFVDYEQMFIDSFRKHSIDISLDIFSVYKNEYPADTAKYDGFLSSGSLSSVYDPDPWIADYQKFVVELHEQKHKHVGICFGHQMIAQALGGKVERAKQGWGLGIMKTDISYFYPWMNSSDRNYVNLIVSHQDQVTKLPENARVIASNRHCPVSMFTIEEHTFGIQAHPEFSKDYSRASIMHRSKIVDADIIDKALLSLANSTDQSIVIHWMANFFSRH